MALPSVHLQPMLDFFVQIRGIELFLIFASVGLLFGSLSFRDSIADMAFIFEGRLVRKLSTFSLSTMLVLTFAAACFFCLVRAIDADWEESMVLLAGISFLFATAALLRLAFQDIAARGPRRRYQKELEQIQLPSANPQTADLHKRAHDASNKRSGT